MRKNDPDAQPGKGEPAKPSASLVDERLFKSRSIFIFGEIDQDTAREVTEKLVALSYESDDDIRLFVNSPGGHVESGDTIYDMIKFVKPRVRIIGSGWVASAAAIIFLAAAKDDRLSLPNTRFLLHQPSGGAGGPATDLAIQAKEILKMRRRINELIARETGQTIDRVELDTDRDYWMTAPEAKEYGMVGRIVERADEV
ncbi:MAG TPA: ATP-dependent Clp protease proteolytic subunit [Candidatus Binatia bacterium]|jgi:ATP-dependent Clp protease protease subunit|nr:ATP-dependent Clp protease proteolytic subunit [Candidatus Binatia bacterium]